MTDARTTTEETGLTTAGIEAYLPSLSNWGGWGDDDRIGTLNLITDEVRVAAAATIRTAGPFRYPARSTRSTQTRWTRVSHWCSVS
jgi:hypothetical protein